MVTTQPNDNYDTITLSTRNAYLEFKVAACKEARMALFQEMIPTNASFFYEVGIGYTDNTQIFLSDSETGNM